MKALACLASLFFVASAVADPMHFEVKNGKCCRWIQATGEIYEDTPTVFEKFLRSSEFRPKVVRLNSQGGSLRGGVLLGELIRTRDFVTEVGSSNLNTDTKAPGVCASACAFTFLGGIERTLDANSSLGFHLFSKPDAPSENDVQELTSLMRLYVLEMGVDARLIPWMTKAGPKAMRWIRPDEARDLRVTTVEPPTQCSACPRAFYYRPGDLNGVSYKTMGECFQVRQQSGNVGVCVMK
jgi:hypothetical protein